MGNALGNSIGHWEGQTLVIETVGTSSPLTRLDPIAELRIAVPLSDQARFVERMRLVERNTLEDQITINDPVAFTRPWTMLRQYRRVPGMKRIVDEDCLCNERNPVINGKHTIAPAR